jgi:hypothetical protein
MDTQTQSQLNSDYILARQFKEGLRALCDPSLKFELSKEFNRRWASHQRAELQYCVEFLARLDKEELDREQAADAAPVHIARSEVRLEMARLTKTHDPATSQDLLLQALADARTSANPQAIFTALLSLGHFYREQDFFDEPGVLDHAEWYYKEALVYCHDGAAIRQMPMVLYWLGVTFARRDETLYPAIFMFDWASRFGPAEFRSLVEKQKCRLRMGERQELLRDTEPPANPDLFQLASAIAAMQALGRRRKKMCELAQQGLDLARRQRDTHWQFVFESILNREDSIPKG